jgi:hypothetical protein
VFFHKLQIRELFVKTHKMKHCLFAFVTANNSYLVVPIIDFLIKIYHFYVWLLWLQPDFDTFFILFYKLRSRIFLFSFHSLSDCQFSRLRGSYHLHTIGIGFIYSKFFYSTVQYRPFYSTLHKANQRFVTVLFYCKLKKN